MILIRDIENKKKRDIIEGAEKEARKAKLLKDAGIEPEKDPEPVVVEEKDPKDAKKKKKKEEEIDPAVIEAARVKKAYELELATYGVSKFLCNGCSVPGYGRVSSRTLPTIRIPSNMAQRLFVTSMSRLWRTLRTPSCLRDSPQTLKRKRR